MMNLESLAIFFFFSLECYHAIGHVSVFLRIRLLPRRDLVRIRLYFLSEVLSMFAFSFLFLHRQHRLLWAAALHIVQHLYYLLFWEKTAPVKKIVSWSSLDWTASEYKEEWHFDSILGVAFDIIVHCSMAFFLGQYLSTVQILLSAILVVCSIWAVMFGPWFAWSTPWAAPKWVQKRIRPLAKEECRLGLSKES